VILAGKDPPPRVVALGRDERVSVTGYVEDMRTVLAEAAVAVCPLVYGAGIQNKVLEALASGVPTVMSVAASQALSGTAGRDYVACDSDEEFAAAVVEVLADEARRARLASSGRDYVVAHHNWHALARRLVTQYERARAAVAVPAASGR
jgi:glycosyltransferase involved in cell wall biosynthesis